MNTSKLLQSISKIVASYTTKLRLRGDEDFMLTPLIGGWSYSEVYSHIFDSSLLSLMALQNCINGKGIAATTPFGSKAVLFFGMLPPGKKYKVPKKLADRVKKIDKITAEKLIADFELQLSAIDVQFDKVDETIKVLHPRLGYLNAKQWLRFIEIHLNHHLKQLGRIEKSFA
jgi:hypothetical protein